MGLKREASIDTSTAVRVRQSTVRAVGEGVYEFSLLCTRGGERRMFVGRADSPIMAADAAVQEARVAGWAI